jgi:hypothetical protein
MSYRQFSKYPSTTASGAIIYNRSEARYRCCCVCYRPAWQVLLKLCDFPIHGGPRDVTCDVLVCTAHAQHREPDYDLCPTHARTVQEEE